MNSGANSLNDSNTSIVYSARKSGEIIKGFNVFTQKKIKFDVMENFPAAQS